MAKYKILLADQEKEYLEPLLLLLLQNYSELYDIHVVTSGEYLHCLLNTAQNIDVAIIGDNLWKPEYRRQDFNNLYILDENYSLQQKSDNVGIVLDKYEEPLKLFQTISVSLRRISKDKKNLCKLIMIYSPQGGCGKTTVAMGISYALKSKGSRVLYCCTDSIQNFGYYLENNSYMNNSLLNELGRGEISFDSIAENIASRTIDYIKPARYSLTSNGIIDKNFIPMIDVIKESNKYDFIIVDCSSDLTKAKTELMEKAEYVVVPLLQNKGGVVALKSLIHNLDTSDKDKFVFVCNAFCKSQKNELREAGVNFQIGEFINKSDSDVLEKICAGQENPYHKLAFQLL